MNVKVFGILCFYFFSPAIFAGEKGNGGDECERRIEEIRSDIESWIEQGGARNLDFSTTQSVVNYEEYEQRMLNSLAIRDVNADGKSAQVPNITVLCTSDEIIVHGEPKTCGNDTNGGEIRCNFERFLQTSENAQYRLIHHEYAGEAGIEPNSGSESDFSLSNQITNFLEKYVIKKLAIKKPSREIHTLAPTDDFSTHRITIELEKLNSKGRFKLLVKQQALLSWSNKSNFCQIEVSNKKLNCSSGNRHTFKQYYRLKYFTEILKINGETLSTLVEILGLVDIDLNIDSQSNLIIYGRSFQIYEKTDPTDSFIMDIKQYLTKDQREYSFSSMDGESNFRLVFKYNRSEDLVNIPKEHRY